ncbi:efflux RND transporter periplasmic adaptor subunit [Paenibacillus sp. P25]|nr:efflux RND transporter periplasmic adaptor subunit [Paenibacillus sp. P25]
MNTAIAADSERAGKKAIRRVIAGFFFAMVALTFFSNTLLNISLAEVEVEKPASGPLSHEVTGSGTIQAADTADLYVETNWPASDVKVKVGDTVEAGQELVLFKTRDAEDALKDNQAKWQQKQLSLQKLQDSYADAFRSGDEKQMRSISRDIDSTRLDAEILERQIAGLQRRLAEFSRLVSPVAGIVTELNAAKGAPVPSGKAAVRISDLSEGLELKATIPETKAQYVKVGDETELIFSVLKNARVKATIADIRDPVSGSSGSSGSAVSSGQETKEITFSLRDNRLKGGDGRIRYRSQNGYVRVAAP